MPAGPRELLARGFKYAKTEERRDRLDEYFFALMANDPEIRGWYNRASKSELKLERQENSTTMILKFAVGVRDFLMKKGVDLSEGSELLSDDEFETVLGRTIGVYYAKTWKPKFLERLVD